MVLLLVPVSSEATLEQIDFLIDGVHGKSNQQLAGGWVYSYTAGTTASKSLYIDAAGSAAHPNPVQLDSYGRVQAWASGKYKLIIKDSNYATVYTIDGAEYDSLSTFYADNTDPFGATLYQTNLTSTAITATSLTSTSITTTNDTIGTATVTNLRVTTTTATNMSVSSLTATLGSNLVASGSKVTGLATGSAAQDATNYGQVVSYDAIVTASAAANASTACAITVPKGVIAMWYGTEANVPSGWHLCNGASDTPDLRGWFIRSASGTDVDIGSWTSPYATSFSRASETYECPMTSYASGTTGTGGLYPVGSSSTDLGTYTVGLTHIGGYYALAYIMKL